MNLAQLLQRQAALREAQWNINNAQAPWAFVTTNTHRHTGWPPTDLERLMDLLSATTNGEKGK